MKKVLFILIISTLGIGVTFSQQNLSTTSLVGTNVDTVLQRYLAGDGVEISNGKFNNQTGNITTLTGTTYSQIGTFNRNGFTNFPFATGLVLTTGDVSTAQGPNNLSGAGTNSQTYYTETALSSLASASLYGAASLEFDFLAYADTFSFNYIFASEEYCEYVYHTYNDIFAFFLTGYDPLTLRSTTKNVAIVPGTVTASNPNGIPVSIDNVNHGYHSSGNGPGSDPANSQYFIHNNSGNTGIQFDGYTTSLSAEAIILACQPYHMKLAVSNVGDNNYDSGVFLEEGSFYSPSISIIPTWDNDWITGDTLIQNCRGLDLKFKLPRPALTNNISVIFNARGTAVLGQDYTLTTPDGHQITPTDNTFSYPSQVAEQNIRMRILPTANFTPEEPVKTAILYIATERCSGRDDTRIYDTLVFYLRGNDSVAVFDKSITTCDMLEEISVLQSGGTGPTFYEWIPTIGIDQPNQIESSCNITESRTYQLVASDQWHCMTDTATVDVTIVPKPEFTVTYTPDHGCIPLPVSLLAQYTPDYATLHWTISNDNYSFTDSTTSVQTSLPEPGYYDINLLVESAHGCDTSTTIPNAIHVSDFPHANFIYSPEEPENGQEVLFFNESTGENITNYTWSFGDGHASYVENPSHTYHLTESDLMTVHFTVTNSDGCSDDTIQFVPVEDNFALYVPNAFTPNVDGLNETFKPIIRDVTNYDLAIYSRMGELVFFTNNPEQGWDGTVKGAPAPEGIYTWIIHYAKIGTPNVIKVKTGSVTLVR